MDACIHTFTHTHTHTHTYIHTYIHTYMHIYIYIYNIILYCIVVYYIILCYIILYYIIYTHELMCIGSFIFMYLFMHLCSDYFRIQLHIYPSVSLSKIVSINYK